MMRQGAGIVFLCGAVVFVVDDGVVDDGTDVGGEYDGDGLAVLKGEGGWDVM